MEHGTTRAQANRAVRQEALRDQLAAKGLVQQVIEASDKLADLTQPLEPNEVNRLKAANDARLSLIKKYLPDLKSTEVTGPNGGPQEHKHSWTVLPVRPANATDTDS